MTSELTPQQIILALNNQEQPSLYQLLALDDGMPLSQRAPAADPTMPEMFANYGVIPLLLTVPLFSVTRKPARHIDQTFTRAGVGSINYSGPQLTQSHLSVLLGLARLFGGEAVGCNFVKEFRPSTFLASIGWSDKHENKVRLVQLLEDLSRGNLKLWKTGGSELYSLRTHIVHKFEPSDDRTVAWKIALDDTILNLFSAHLNRTYLGVSERSQLREGLGTFLHGYIRANSCGFPIAFRAVYEACGSTTRFCDFCCDVREHLDNLKALGLIRYWVPGKEAGKFCVFK